MIKLSRKTIFILIAGTFLVLLLAGIYFNSSSSVDNVADMMDRYYSVSATNFDTNMLPFDTYKNWFYYTEERFGTVYIVGKKRGEKEVIFKIGDKLADIDLEDMNFAVMDEETFIVESNGEMVLITKNSGEIIELGEGDCITCFEDEIYYSIKNNGYIMVCSYSVSNGKREELLTCNRIISTQRNGFVFEKNDGIYFCSLPFGENSEYQLPDDIQTTYLLGGYIFTEKGYIYLAADSIEIYSFETGLNESIYSIFDGIMTLAACANDDYLYVSRRLVDIKFCPIKDSNNVNGTYRYSFENSEWEKINDTVYSDLAFFDGNYLYGLTYDSCNIDQIDVN